jgi:hypothetical protein
VEAAAPKPTGEGGLCGRELRLGKPRPEGAARTGRSKTDW